MVTVLMTHEVDDLKHWLQSPDRGPAFASIGFTVETFVDPTAGNKVGILLEGPSLAICSRCSTARSRPTS